MGMSIDTWKQCELGEVVTLKRGYDLPHRLRHEGQVPVVSSSGISDRHNRAQIAAPGVVMGRYGTIGEVFYITEDFWPLNTTLYVQDFKGNDPLYLSYLLRTIDFQSHSGKSGVPGVNRNDLHRLYVVIPPIPEQRAIAAALADVDGLITALDRLIAKKRAIKQATMQQLLTGKTRLPGFGGAWETKRLGEVLEKVVGGGTPSRSNPNFWGGDIPWVTVKDFVTFHPHRTQESITKEGLSKSASNLIPSGTLITSTRMALGKAVIYKVDVSINQDLKALFTRQNVSVQYLYYWFEYHASTLEEMGSGSTVKGLALNDLKSIEFMLADFAEQRAIAAVLSDMDAEIAALEQRRDKTQAIKQGMMQQLLTGRVRLTSEEEPV
jgi:type I restriction enzyme S subunit